MAESVIIFGSGGQLGFALRNIFPEAVSVSRSQCDIADSKAVKSICEKYKPTVIINAAAYADVEKAESVDMLEAYRVNAVGAQILSLRAQEYDAVLVHISTDYVFNGKKESFSELDSPHPLNVHGLSKLASEYTVAAYCSKYYVIRTSALFGPSEKVPAANFVSKRVQQIQEGLAISMVSDQWTVPTYTCDLADAVKNIITKQIPYGVYHCVNSGGGVTWFNLTKEIALIMNSDIKLIPITTADTNSVVPRPRNSVLDTAKLESFGVKMPAWKDSLRVYLDAV